VACLHFFRVQNVYPVATAPFSFFSLSFFFTFTNQPEGSIGSPPLHNRCRGLGASFGARRRRLLLVREARRAQNFPGRGVLPGGGGFPGRRGGGFPRAAAAAFHGAAVWFFQGPAAVVSRAAGGWFPMAAAFPLPNTRVPSSIRPSVPTEHPGRPYLGGQAVAAGFGGGGFPGRRAVASRVGGGLRGRRLSQGGVGFVGSARLASRAAAALPAVAASPGGGGFGPVAARRGAAPPSVVAASMSACGGFWAVFRRPAAFPGHMAAVASQGRRAALGGGGFGGKGFRLSKNAGSAS